MPTVSLPNFNLRATDFVPAHLEAPALVLDRVPVVVEPANPPAFFKWGGPSQLKVVGATGTQAARPGWGVEAVDSGPGEDETEPPPQKPGVSLVLEEVARSSSVIEVKGDDSCSITFQRIDDIVFSVPPELGLPIGSLLMLRMKNPGS